MSNVENSNNIVVGTGNCKVSVAPYTESMTYPSVTDPSTPLPAAYTPLGLTTDDGVTFNTSANTNDIMAWQNEYSVRTLITGRTCTLSFTCIELNQNSLALALGGATYTMTSGKGSIVGPTSGQVDERSLVVEWQDGSEKKFRIVVPRGIATADVSATVNRNGEMQLPITFNANPKSNPVAGEPTTFPFYWVTNAKGLSEAVTS